jgi:hypothetical protein
MTVPCARGLLQRGANPSGMGYPRGGPRLAPGGKPWEHRRGTREKGSVTKAGESIDLLRYAEVRATLRFFPAEKKDEVLARLGLRRHAWDAADDAFGEARDAELASGKTEISARFGSAFARTLRRLTLAPPTLGSLGPLAEPGEAPRAAPPPAGAAAQAADPAAAPAAQGLPSYLQPVLSEVRRPPEDMTATALLPSPALSAPTPFVAKKSTPTQAFKAAVAHAEIVQGPAAKDAPRAFGRTVGLDGAAPAGVAPPPPGVPVLTLAQYASLKVDLRNGGGADAPILARYGVPPDAWPALNAHWQARFEADPLSRMEFVRAYSTYTAWLKQNAQPQRG